MDHLNLSAAAQNWVNLVFLWIGFGTVVGLVVRGLVPGKEPSGPVSTLLIGITGSCIGPLVVTLLWPMESFNPISPVGFAASLICAFLCLIFYRMGILLLKRRYHQGMDR
ncbi:MAG: GlsB/YeaQ/YmgE family stress response membrane protein [Planctomycetaceae bacterium]|jgi:uncharacterized membrane protein YeaQ/YmgE (transglycosylase-associated protein family)|nr:GlsB/YeaQ/YmgE family stress response membrane protein [Planctomycetaceae bacterium]